MENDLIRRSDLLAKKCKYYIRELMSPGSGWCECLERGEYEKHFCSYGERKEGTEK